MKIARESWVIGIIGIADLVTTIVFIQHHGAQEANPLFRHYWEMGLTAFIAAKMICLLGPLLILEWARKSSPRFVSLALRGAIAGYVLLYGVGFMRLNGVGTAHAAEIVSLTADEVPLYIIKAQIAEERFMQTPHGLLHKYRGVRDTAKSQTAFDSGALGSRCSPSPAANPQLSHLLDQRNGDD